MKIIKDMMKSAIVSMMVSFTIFAIVGVIFDVINGGVFMLENHMFSKMVLACMVVGLGFGVPSAIYQFENIPLAIRTIIHLGIGLAVYFVAALNVGWIPRQAGVMACVVTIVGGVVITFVIWLGFMRYNKRLAGKMNEAIREKESNYII